MRTTILLIAVATAVPAAAQAPQTPSTLTYPQALDLAKARNLGLEAARRLRTIREAAIRPARQRLNPAIGFETSQDSPHQVFTFDLPLELGGRRGRRVDLA